jgi:hypothetical protein
MTFIIGAAIAVLSFVLGAFTVFAAFAYTIFGGRK